MDFIQKLDFLMKKYNLNKRTLSLNSGIPYTTIDNWYKRGYDGMKISTLRTLSNYFNTVLDFWIRDDITDPNYWKNGDLKEKAPLYSSEALALAQDYDGLDGHGKRIVRLVAEEELTRCKELAAAGRRPMISAAARSGGLSEMEAVHRDEVSDNESVP